MKSLISEFSYGFALTHELVLALGSLTAAPIFPSLIAEGKAGGGYDVKLEAPGLPMFLQFKRSDCLSRRNAREIAAGVALSVPYYRLEITGRADSRQHEMLLELDQAPNLVFYAAPMFHKKTEFDSAFLARTVRQRSFYVRPGTIGSFTDDEAHHLSFDGTQFVVMSKPRVIEGYGAAELEGVLMERLAAEKRPLHQIITAALDKAEAARIRSRERFGHGSRKYPDVEEESVLVADDDGGASALEDFRKRQEEAIKPVPQLPVPVDPQAAALQRLADIGLREFNAQLYVVQAKESA